MEIEDIILENLLHNEEYTRRVLPYLKDEYFNQNSYKIAFHLINRYVGKYNRQPSQEELVIELQNQKGLTQSNFEQTLDLVKTLQRKPKAQGIDWLIEHTERFCQDKALYNAIVASAGMIEKREEVGQIPDLLKDALAVSFDNNIGHDFRDQLADRYRMLHQTTEYRIPFSIKALNDITLGGLPRKTLNVIVAASGAGKSLFMTHCAAQNLLNGLNVLYLTMEMAEERICERIDANIMDMTISDLGGLSLQRYSEKLEAKLGDSRGRLIVKEYPTASAGVQQFRSLLNELKLKKDFAPDIIYVDYLNICASSRFKAGAVNSYQYVKAITEEVRGLAIEFNLPILTATQFNRNGMDNSDVGVTDVSDSSGIVMTADLMLAMIRTEELDAANQVMFKQLKNRFTDMTSKIRFTVGINRSKMKLYDNDTPIQTSSGGQPLVNGSPVINKPMLRSDRMVGEVAKTFKM